MKRETNRQRCRKCTHNCVCCYQSYFDNVDRLGERCNHYSPKKDLKTVKSKARKELKDRIKNSCRVMGMDYCEYYIKDDIDRVLEEMENTDE